MFVSGNQFFVFVSCVAFGGAVGVILTLPVLVKKIFKVNWLKILLDILTFLVASFVFMAYRHYFCFPDFRVYMLFGVFVGIILYFESFYIILAKFLKKIYNLFKRKKVRKDDRFQV